MKKLTLILSIFYFPVFAGNPIVIPMPAYGEHQTTIKNNEGKDEVVSIIQARYVPYGFDKYGDLVYLLIDAKRDTVISYTEPKDSPGL